MPWPLVLIGLVGTGVLGAAAARRLALTRELAARRLLWLGLLVPFVWAQPKTHEQVSAGGALSLLDLVRGGGGLACLLLAVLLQRPPGRLRLGGLTVGLIVYLGTASASTLWSVNPNATVLKAAVLVVAYLTLLLLVSSYLSFEQAISALAMFVHGVLLSLPVQLLIVPSVAYHATALPRLQSAVPYIHANLLALVAVVGILALLLRLGPRWILRARPALLVLYAAELLATRARSAAFVGLLIVVVVAGRAAARSRPVAAACCLTAAAALAGMLLLVNLGGSDDATGFVRRGQDDQGIATLTGRTLVWERSLDVWKDHQLLGTGYYSGHRLGLVPYLHGIGDDRANLDSTWVESLVDVGILGTAGLAAFVLAGLARLARQPSSPARTLAGCVAVLGVAMSLVNSSLQHPNSTMVLLGFVLCAGSTLPATTEPTPAGLGGAQQRPDRLGGGGHGASERARERPRHAGLGVAGPQGLGQGGDPDPDPKRRAGGDMHH
jgi:O-antigen ligase